MRRLGVLGRLLAVEMANTMRSVSADFNIFDVLNVKPVEDPHDRMVAWLCDPNGGHGIPDFASAIIRRLWDQDWSEVPRSIRRPFMLTSESWPDVGVEFSDALLLIENKVQASALREGQIELQHELGRQRQAMGQFFHCVLCPDYLSAAIPQPSEMFRTLRYSELAQILASYDGMCTPEAVAIVRQYAAFIRSAFGSSRAAALRVASAQTIARRNAAREPWEWEQILEQAVEHGGTDLAALHQELLDILVSMQDIAPRFVSTGSVERTYQVFAVERDVSYLLLVYATGRLYVSWEGFLRTGQDVQMKKMQSVWAPFVTGARNRTGSYTKQPLGALPPELVASLLQETVDAVWGQSPAG